MSEIKLHIEDDRAFKERAAKLARQIDQGQDVRGEDHLSFGSLELLLKTLTPGRWGVLRALKAKGPSSIRALAGQLGRDYKAVHADVAALLNVGLIMRDDQGLISVPWDRLSADLDLHAA
jgi:predicted transcriptional regulator